MRTRRLSEISWSLLCLVIRLVLIGFQTAVSGLTERYGSYRYPTFIPTQTNFTFHRGEKATLICSVANLGTKTVTWRSGSHLHPLTVGETTYTEDEDYQINHIAGSTNWNLEIKNVQPRHAGSYECQVSTKDKKLRRIVYLNVIDPHKGKKSAINITGRFHVDRGDPIVLTCNATGVNAPPDDIDWFKDGQKISTDVSKQIEITKQYSLNAKTFTSQLRMQKASMEDTGTYICRTSDLQVISKKVNILNAEKNVGKRNNKELEGSIHEKPLIDPSNSGHRGTVSKFTLTLVSILAVFLTHSQTTR